MQEQALCPDPYPSDVADDQQELAIPGLARFRRLACEYKRLSGMLAGTRFHRALLILTNLSESLVESLKHALDCLIKSVVASGKARVYVCS